MPSRRVSSSTAGFGELTANELPPKCAGDIRSFCLIAQSRSSCSRLNVQLTTQPASSGPGITSWATSPSRSAARARQKASSARRSWMTRFLPAMSDKCSKERGLTMTGSPSRASISAADGGTGASVFGTAKPSPAISATSRALSLSVSMRAKSGTHRAQWRSSVSRCLAMNATRRSEEERSTGRSSPSSISSCRRRSSRSASGPGGTSTIRRTKRE